MLHQGTAAPLPRQLIPIHHATPRVHAPVLTQPLCCGIPWGAHLWFFVQLPVQQLPQPPSSHSQLRNSAHISTLPPLCRTAHKPPHLFHLPSAVQQPCTPLSIAPSLHCASKSRRTERTRPAAVQLSPHAAPLPLEREPPAFTCTLEPLAIAPSLRARSRGSASSTFSPCSTSPPDSLTPLVRRSFFLRVGFLRR